jgi:DNA polymerase III delta prime subunit
MKMRLKNHPILSKGVASQQLPHALLFVGGTLSDKLTSVIAWTQLLLCEKHQGCQHCAPCQWVSNRTHPDLRCFPEEKNTTIKIDDVREVIYHLNQSSHQGKYKIVILAPAEAMPVAAMQALLKVLEEPAPNSLLLLLSQYPSLLLPTIRSRCQRIVLFKKEHTSILAKPSSQLSETLQALHTRQLSPFQAAEQWQKMGLNELLEELYLYQVRCVLNHVSKSQNYGKNITKMFAWYDLINKARSQLLHKCNPNSVILLEHLFYEWAALHDAS